MGRNSEAGRRVGTPFCITVDHDIKRQYSNDSVQRYHAAATGERYIKGLQKIIKQETDIRSWLMKTNQ